VNTNILFTQANRSLKIKLYNAVSLFLCGKKHSQSYCSVSAEALKERKKMNHID
jgi:hypothetical protein